MPVCVSCAHFEAGKSSHSDKCSHAENVVALHPYAVRADGGLCGPSGAWFLKDDAKAARAAQWSVGADK